MFTNAVRACSNRTSREFFKNELKRHISKTSSVPNSECMSSRQQTRNPEKIASTKWMKLRKHSNIRWVGSFAENSICVMERSLRRTWRFARSQTGGVYKHPLVHIISPQFSQNYFVGFLNTQYCHQSFHNDNQVKLVNKYVIVLFKDIFLVYRWTTHE